MNKTSISWISKYIELVASKYPIFVVKVDEIKFKLVKSQNFDAMYM